MAKVEIDLPELPKSKPKKTTAEKKKNLRHIPKARLKKPGLGKQVAASFVSEEVENVKSFVIFDVFVPTIKETILDVISMILFNDSYSSRGRTRNRGTTYGRSSYTSYNNYYKSDRERGNERREDKRYFSRRSSDAPVVEFDNRQDAKDLIVELEELIDEYGSASVGDMISIVGGDQPNPQDERWGWDDWEEVHRCAKDIRRVSNGGYSLTLPKPRPID